MVLSMRDAKLIVAFGTRILIREWRRFVLPFLSFTITAIVMALMLLLTEGGEKLIEEKSRELNGGDVTLESVTPIDALALIRDLELQDTTISETREFTITVTSKDATSPIQFVVADSNYPLYGTVELGSGSYTDIEASEILLDQNALTRLGVQAGDTVSIGDTSYLVRDRIVSEPNSLFGGFRFLPRALMNQAGYERLSINPELLRIEYEYAYKIPTLTSGLEERIAIYSEEAGLHLHIAGKSHSGTDAGFTIVSEFLILAVLITSVLGAVNVYASTLYLIRMERKSLAVLLALGMRKRSLLGVLGSALFIVVLGACAVGLGVSFFLFDAVRDFGARVYAITLPTPSLILPFTLTALLVSTTAIASFLPAVRSLFSLTPREILTGSDTNETEKTTLRTVGIITLATLIPLLFLAIVLLQSFYEGILAMGIILGVYLLIALLFRSAVGFFYRIRKRTPFLIRSIIAHKRADGIFGIISFTSLFVALLALGTLTLTQISLERYLKEDLARSIPTTYVLDVQPSQKDSLASQFPDLTLFPNVGARIVSIDGVRIQDALARGDDSIDGELGREYNLTYRTELLQSERVTEGSTVIGKKGELSVDTEFAERANIQIGSEVTFLIQGFEVEGSVTSLRETDSRSGLPFFYFILSPEDLQLFPSVSFGYAYYDIPTQDDLGTFLGKEMPNVTMIKTQAVRPQLEALIETLMVLVVTITLPPLLVAILLIVTLVVSNYSIRKREGARMRALGATRGYMELEYHSESLSLTLVSSILAYGASVLIAGGLSVYYLKIDSFVLFDPELVLGIIAILILVGIIGIYLYRSDRTALRELLSYEDQ